MATPEGQRRAFGVAYFTCVMGRGLCGPWLRRREPPRRKLILDLPERILFDDLAIAESIKIRTRPADGPLGIATCGISGLRSISAEYREVRLMRYNLERP